MEVTATSQSQINIIQINAKSTPTLPQGTMQQFYVCMHHYFGVCKIGVKILQHLKHVRVENHRKLTAT